MPGKPKQIEDLSVAELYELLERIREESPDASSVIDQYLSVEVCKLGDIYLRVTTEDSYAMYQTATQWYQAKHYCILHNLWTARTRTIMGNTEKNLITANGYLERPHEWTYQMLEQACRHHGGG